MSTVRTFDHGGGDGRFLVVRKGYDRAAVDQFAHDVQGQVNALQRRLEAVEAENHQLHGALDQAPRPSADADFSSLGGRAQEILRIAEEQARDTTQSAYAEADSLVARAQQEAARLRDRTTEEVAEIRRAELDELAELRRRGEEDAGLLVGRAQVESEQLLAAARLQAEAVRVESETVAHGLVEAAQLEAQGRLATAERAAADLARTSAEQQERTLADLQHAQEAANEAVATMLADATAHQTVSANHLSDEAEQAATLRREALAEAEQARLDAVGEAEQIIARAQTQAATIDERARQEFTWRRRQMRQEQDLLARRKQAMLSQLTSLSALAVETAGSLPEVPEMTFSDFEDADDQGPAQADQAPVAETAPAQAEADALDGEVPDGDETAVRPAVPADAVDETVVRTYADTRRR